MKKAERIESNKLYLKNCGFEYNEEHKVYYRTYGNNDKPIYIKEYQLDIPSKQFDALVEKLRLQAQNFENIIPSDLYELDRTMEKINRIVKEQQREKPHPEAQEKSINTMSVEELQSLKTKVEQTLREKGIKQSRKPKDLDKRKPSLRVRKSIYLEMYYRDQDGKVVCKYLGKIGDKETEKKLKKLGKPELLDEYWKLKIKRESEYTQIDLFT